MERGEGFAFEAKKSEIIKALASHGIDIFKYGQGEAKPVENLVKEVLDGETNLVEDEKGEMIRETSIATARVIHCMSDGTVLRLKEDRQEFKDGRVRNRDEVLGEVAISEKLKAGENPLQAIMRAICDKELKVEGDFTISDVPVVSSSEKNSQSFPDLTSRYNDYRFEVELGEEAFNPGGYVEKQADKTNYWVWVEESDTAR